MSKAVLILSHGSRLVKTRDEVANLTERIKKATQLSIVEFAFLELLEPSIPEGVDACVAKGASEIVVLMNFLNAGRHVDTDIPTIIDECKIKHPSVTFKITKPVGQHEGITALFCDLINHA